MTVCAPLSRGLAVLLLLLGPAAGIPSPAQPVAPAPTDSLRAYVEQIRAATRRFQDHDAAVAAGYRWMGPDMPNMGEHWIHPRLVMRRPFDPMRPSALSYVRRDGARLLTGVAYILPVRPGESPPAFPVGGPWHFHRSTLEDEAFGHHPDHEHSGPADDAVRLAMMHAWVWVDNPDGLFAADNWALPYVRRGLPVPDTVHPAAAKALFLTVPGGPEYVLKTVTTNAAPTPEEHAVIREALRGARDRVEAALQAAPSGTAPDADALDAIWNAAWRTVERTVRPSLWRALRPIMLPPPS